MTNAFDFNTLPDLTRDRLQSELERFVKQMPSVVPSDRDQWIIRTSELNPNAKSHPIVDEVASWAGKGSVFLYYIRVLGPPNFDDIAKYYPGAKDKGKDERAYARVNNQHQRSSYFYVGSSKNITQRLKDHLGYCSKKTYSLQLVHWTPSLPLKLEFICAKYPKSASPESLKVYQALEDTLWERLKPMFGRQGKR
jgi:hypothetical protein